MMCHLNIPKVLNKNTALFPIDLDFYQAIGEIEIVISQHGTVIHSSFENIESSMIRSIQLSQGLSGDFLLEIKGRNGAYAYGWFTIN